jgi:hypothetical protein
VLVMIADEVLGRREFKEEQARWESDHQNQG